MEQAVGTAGQFWTLWASLLLVDRTEDTGAHTWRLVQSLKAGQA